MVINIQIMSSNSFKLNVQTVQSSLPNNSTKSYYKLINSGIADLNRIIDEIMAVNPGLERETVEAVLKLEQRIITKLTLNGMRVNTGLFSAVATPKGEGGSKWDNAKNKLNIKITQGTYWREKIRQTLVNVLGMKADVMYIDKVTSNSDDNTINPGDIINVTGNFLKLAGEDENVGIYFVNETNETTKVEKRHIAVNEPKKLTFSVPSSLKAGEYTLRIITLFSRSNYLLKEPRIAEHTVIIE